MQNIIKKLTSILREFSNQPDRGHNKTNFESFFDFEKIKI